MSTVMKLLTERRLGRKAGLIGLAALVVLLPIIVKGGYYMHIAVMTGIYMMLTLSMGVLYGEGKIISLAHGTFFGIGGYVSAILATRFGTPPILGMPLSFVASAFVAYLLMIPLAKLKHLYLAIATLAFSHIVYTLAKDLTMITGGFSGLANVPPLQFGSLTLGPTSPEKYYYLVYFLVALTFLSWSNLTNSLAGKALRALADKEIAARMVGINPFAYKRFLFAFASGCAGLGGFLYVHYNGHISPDAVGIRLSVLALLAVYFGGLTSRWGNVLAATFIVLIPEYISRVGDFDTIVYGMAILLVVMFAPRGIAGLISNLYRRIKLLYQSISTHHGT